MDTATLTQEETEAALDHARSEVSRLRAALTMIQSHAALLLGSANGRGETTLATGFELLAGIAHDALEQ
jgi:hypothetical protein